MNWTERGKLMDRYSIVVGAPMSDGRTQAWSALPQFSRTCLPVGCSQRVDHAIDYAIDNCQRAEREQVYAKELRAEQELRSPLAVFIADHMRGTQFVDRLRYAMLAQCKLWRDRAVSCEAHPIDRDLHAMGYAYNECARELLGETRGVPDVP